MKSPAVSRQIALRRATTLWSSYEGRGIPSRSLQLPAGAIVTYEAGDRDAAADYLPFVERRHCITARHADGRTYSRHETTYSLRRPFDAASYYGGAIEQLRDGCWSTGTAGARYVADDGFGNLIDCPDHRDVRRDHYSTARRVDDCVLGACIVIGDSVRSVEDRAGAPA